MMLPRPLRSFKAIRKPGKSGPVTFAFSNQGPPLPDFTKNIRLKNKTLCPDKPSLGSQAEGFAKTDVFGASPVASALDQCTGRDPSTPGFTISPRLQSYTRRTGCFLQVESSFLPNASPQQ